MPVEESDSGSTWLHPPSYEIEGLCMASVGIPLANFTVGSGTGSPKQPEGHWEEGKNVQDSGRDVQSVSGKDVVLISSNFVLFKNLKLYVTPFWPNTFFFRNLFRDNKRHIQRRCYFPIRVFTYCCF